MRYKAFWLIVFAVFLICGCGQPSEDSTEETGVDVPVVELGTEDAAEKIDDSAVAPESSDAATIDLTPKNTTIGFVGTHIVEEGPDPNARSGQFGAFAGQATIIDGMLTGVSVEIETSSLQTENEKLTGHLKSPDFFDVREHAKASFVSTSIEPRADGQVTIQGDLTLLSGTEPISFPAAVSTDNGLELTAEFTIDRTTFGMNYGLDKVEKAVLMSISISNK